MDDPWQEGNRGVAGMSRLGCPKRFWRVFGRGHFAPIRRGFVSEMGPGQADLESPILGYLCVSISCLSGLGETRRAAAATFAYLYRAWKVCARPPRVTKKARAQKGYLCVSISCLEGGALVGDRKCVTFAYLYGAWWGCFNTRQEEGGVSNLKHPLF